MRDSNYLKINASKPDALVTFRDHLFTLLDDTFDSPFNSLVVLCIGSDRSTGDALGPLTGSFLKHLQPQAFICGTLDDPVHCINLREATQKIYQNYNSPMVIAIDASLGQPGSIGFIEMGCGPLYPGAGVNKKIKPVGDIFITGIVNVGGFLEQMVLQSTRLSIVFSLAEFISTGIYRTLNQYVKKADLPSLLTEPLKR